MIIKFDRTFGTEPQFYLNWIFLDFKVKKNQLYQGIFTLAMFRVGKINLDLNKLSTLNFENFELVRKK